MDPLFLAILTYMGMFPVHRSPLSPFPKEALGMLLLSLRNTFCMQGTVQAAPCMGYSAPQGAMQRLVV